MDYKENEEWGWLQDMYMTHDDIIKSIDDRFNHITYDLVVEELVDAKLLKTQLDSILSMLDTLEVELEEQGDYGYDSGYEYGLREGYDDGFRDGHGEGHDEGHSEGYDEGLTECEENLNESNEDDWGWLQDTSATKEQLTTAVKSIVADYGLVRATVDNLMKANIQPTQLKPIMEALVDVWNDGYDSGQHDCFNDPYEDYYTRGM